MSVALQHRFPGTNCDPGLVYEEVNHSASNWSPAAGGIFRAIWVSVAGNVRIIDSKGIGHTFPNVPVGLISLGGLTIVTGTTTATVTQAVME